MTNIGTIEIQDLFVGSKNAVGLYQGDVVIWEKSAPPTANWLCFTAEEANSTVAMGAEGSAPTVSLECSTDGSTWSPFVVGTTTVTLANIGDKVYVRATSAGNTGLANLYSTYNKFVMTGKISASGNVDTLLDQNGNATLTNYCYVGLFRGCTSLTTAPSLPATTLANNCYLSMFFGCTSLTTAPSLPATTLAENCYRQMFYGCSSLTSAPELPATTLANNCYYNMFTGCSNLNSITLGYTGNFADAPANAFSNWVSNVASTGTFYYNGSDTTTGASAIPTGWTVVSTTTKVKYTTASGLSDWAGDIVGELTNSSIPNMSDIAEVEIGSHVTSIGNQAFYGCYSLTSITIPDSVTSIGYQAFGGCDGLTSMTIPSSVRGIGSLAFSSTTKLTAMTFDGKAIAQVQMMGNYAEWFGTYPPRSVTITCFDGSFVYTVSCFLKGTDILLTDGTSKKIENLTYDDVLKVWDFDEGQLGSAKVCWLTRPGLKSDHYYQLTFDNGTFLKTTGINSNHRIFSVDKSKFVNVSDAKVGDKVFSIDGTLTITDVQYVEEECEYHNVMTSEKINCFANGILTSDRYGNLYPIVDMKYVKDGRTIRPYSEYEAVGIDRYWYDNLRLGENNETIEQSKQYVWKCLGQMLPIPEQK